MLANALQGVRVIDLSRILAGPWCTQNLADLGADVLKIERPVQGDDTRGWGPPFATAGSGEKVAAYFLSCNRGKQSVTADFADAADRDWLLRQVRDADVLVENYKVGTLAKYGLDYASLAAINPGLIYLSVTGFGQSGPFAHKPGYDYIFQGMGGLMSYTGIADGEPGAGPLRTGVAVVDLMTGMYATSAVLAALVQRARTGRGQHLDIALLDVAVAMNANQASNYLVSGESPARIGNTHPNLAPYEVFACADGHVILAIGNDTQFVAFCRLMGADWHLQPDFATNAGRLTHLKRLRPLLREKLAAWRVEALGRALDEHGISWGNVNDMEQVFAHPQVRHRQMLQTVDHPQLGTLRLVRNPMVPAGRDAPVTPPPVLGPAARPRTHQPVNQET
ncbi:CoA transferase [Alicycliphilus denitrificans]|uniref:Formyl-CoA transferase n=2 Tax=Alicycliphilus denitrificans TaxID=179636 RepID=F4GA04_ALIDK|nr:CoA transferase [Alicycliphilus denitrificans]ADV01865.1 L-carnitine dehydratase/bile acid-inducible protein F [Alicycliphilus denitrificans BC]AEB86807.1 Formyl-CoA transferase [Alicycliphilus denitrificans K601]QKD45959.1 CoA transferase [Alicycliphilus denitrificans]GAO25461.1 acyl-CoA transferase [Alicycliphilus sp. B1]